MFELFSSFSPDFCKKSTFFGNIYVRIFKRGLSLEKYLIAGSLREFLEDYLKSIEDVLGALKKSIKKAPSGTLKVVKRQAGVQFYYRKSSGDKQGRYLSKKNLDFAGQLAQKKYDVCVEKLLLDQKRFVDKLLSEDLEKKILGIYEGFFPEVQGMINPSVLSPEKFAEIWQAVEYKRLSVDGGPTDLLTIRGEQVRSKSEIMIADALFHAKVPYRYEFPVRIKGRGIFHPDFLCLNKRTGKEVVWEHFGLMDNPEYAANALEKITLYAQNGFVLGNGFIYTMETSARPLSSRLVKQLIDAHFL